MNLTRQIKRFNNSTVHDFTKFLSFRKKTTQLSIKDKRKWLQSEKLYGQPTFKTHPHLLKENELVQGIKLEEIVTRRTRLADTIKAYSSSNHTTIKNHLIVIPSGTKKFISASIPYVFRQNSDFLYLTGCLEQDSLLVLEINEKSTKSVLFLRPKDKNAELWDGTRTGPDNAIELFGVDQAFPINGFQDFVEKFKKQSATMIWYDEKNSDQKNLSQILNPPKEGFECPTKFIHTLRWIKSESEIELMRKTCDIASNAINSTIKKSHPQISEHQIFAEVDYQCRRNGAHMLAYPPVVASGRNSTTIHYINNTQIVKDGDMVLLDAGCEYGGYSSDITRTWPINGSFTDSQRVLYEIVLNLQKDLIRNLLNSGGLTLDELFDTMCLRLGKYLQEIHLIPSDKSGYDLARAAYKFCPHHVSHYLGMDVHDTALVSRSNKLVPGNVFTVEPGIYMSEERQDVPEEFRGLGLRIEDDVLVTPNMKIEILTSQCAKETADLLKSVNNE
ncbi:CLUMA_CG003262, isoform A [Clunio marinus]|uniref:CLUMA_CG003262, isoform A n=1 Tax=Clunio marinus TaxID=568069 RepID=A0A1J1HTU4_9DIPT|nr:CLUMA_CG003262, isoform A [Clunio marinus]